MSYGKGTGKRHYCVDNDECYPGQIVIRGHVDKNSLTWHQIPKGDAVVKKHHQVQKNKESRTIFM